MQPIWLCSFMHSLLRFPSTTLVNKPRNDHLKANTRYWMNIKLNGRKADLHTPRDWRGGGNIREVCFHIISLCFLIRNDRDRTWPAIRPAAYRFSDQWQTSHYYRLCLRLHVHLLLAAEWYSPQLLAGPRRGVYFTCIVLASIRCRWKYMLLLFCWGIQSRSNRLYEFYILHRYFS